MGDPQPAGSNGAANARQPRRPQTRRRQEAAGKAASATKDKASVQGEAKAGHEGARQGQAEGRRQ